MSDIMLNVMDEKHNKVGGRSTGPRIARTRAGAPLALVEDDTDLPPERPSSGSEVDDLLGGSEADDMFPNRTNKNNDNPGVDNALIPRTNGGNPPDREEPEEGRRLPDINVYQKKKIFAQGMMDLALITANANQLRYVLDAGSDHSYYYVNVTCIVISILLQISVGILLLWNSRYNIHKEPHIILANKINNFTVIGIFMITVLNVFISAFGVPKTTDLKQFIEIMERQQVETLPMSHNISANS